MNSLEFWNLWEIELKKFTNPTLANKELVEIYRKISNYFKWEIFFVCKGSSENDSIFINLIFDNFKGKHLMIEYYLDHSMGKFYSSYWEDKNVINSFSGEDITQLLWMHIPFISKKFLIK